MKSSIKKYLYWLIFAIQLFPLAVFSQYLGGDADGYANNVLIQTACPSLENINIFSGGDADGYAVNRLTQTVCSSLENINIFSGGDADGYAVNKLTQAVCSPLENTNAFFGGNADGYVVNKLTQAVCSPLENTNVFFGGDAEGNANDELIQIICPPPLPIELLSFEAQCEQKDVVLKWTTSTEINNNYFSIERSNDAVNWLKAGTIKGAGNSDQPLNYTFKDVRSSAEAVYYRLMQTDFDGKYTYTKIVITDCNNDNPSKLFVYPNPNKGKFTIEGFNLEVTNEIKIYNLLGEIVYGSEASENFIEVDLNDRPKGAYFIHIFSETGSTIHKIIIQ